MKSRDWVEIQNDCPLTYEECRSFFMERYLYDWKQFFTQYDSIVGFLETKGIDIEIEKAGKGWFYKIWLDDRLVSAAKRFKDLDKAFTLCIKEAFLELET